MMLNSPRANNVAVFILVLGLSSILC